MSTNGNDMPSNAPTPTTGSGATGTGCEMRTRAYRNGELIDESFPAERISDHLQDAGTIVWLDLLDPDINDLQIIPDEFGFHELAIADAANDRQRPKLDRYDSHLFLNTYSVQLDDESGSLHTSEVSAFVTPQALITIRKSSDFPIDKVVRRWDDNAEVLQHGVGFLLHGLLDFVIDGHFTTVQQLDDAIEGLEDDLFSPHTHNGEVQRRSFHLRKSLVRFRHVALPMREVVNSLMRREMHVVDQDLMPYYQDVYDHILRVTEWTESLRDLVTSVLETNLSIQSNRLNEVMKQLTAWAAIIAVPTAITGFYGQNVPYPGDGQTWGFVTSSVLILIIAGLLWAQFKRRDWL